MSVVLPADCPMLVTGASGTTGGRLAALLRARGTAVRAASRSGGGVNGMRFDWHDPSTHDAVLAGIRRAYLIPPVPSAAPEGVMLPFLDRARAAGVERVVLLGNSVVPGGGPGIGLVQQAVAASFPQWAVLRPSWFMQNLFGDHPHARMLRQSGMIVTATGDARVGFVDAGDIAHAAAAVLLADDAPDADFVLTGPQALSYGDLAGILTDVTGRWIVHEAVSPDALPGRYEAIGIAPAAARFLAVLDGVIASGREDRTTDCLATLTGRLPRSFHEVAGEESSR